MSPSFVGRSRRRYFQFLLVFCLVFFWFSAVSEPTALFMVIVSAAARIFFSPVFFWCCAFVMSLVLLLLLLLCFFFGLPKAGLGNCRPAAFRRHPIDPALNTGLISQRTRPACLIFRNQPERSRSIAVSGADRTEDNEKRKTG